MLVVLCESQLSKILEVNPNQNQLQGLDLIPSSLWGQVFGPLGPPLFETPHHPIPLRTPLPPPAPQRTQMWSCSSS